MKVNVIGGGLSGSEAALQLANRGFDVVLFEMRPGKSTEAHKTGNFAELVCSNSLGSVSTDDARGLLKEESISLGSVLLDIAMDCRVPAGKALAVDRIKFSSAISKLVLSNPHITVAREEVKSLGLEGVTILATGPLTSETLLNSLFKMFGEDNLFFYDAISPIVSKESLDLSKTFYGARYSQSDDYINAPMSREQYSLFYEGLINAERHVPHDFDRKFFESCLPIEEIASRGFDAMRYGPLTPKGFNGNHFAIVQLRRENKEGTLYELVGFQTSLTYEEQKKIFRLIPGLQNAEFMRLGSIHKNAFLKSSKIIAKTLQTKIAKNLFIAGQLSGVEGYVESIATGLLAGVNASKILSGRALIELSENTMLGSLIRFIVDNELSNPQPMRANFGLMSKVFFDIPKAVRKEAFVKKSREAISKLKEAL